jgi:hypothetical protein
VLLCNQHADQYDQKGSAAQLKVAAAAHSTKVLQVPATLLADLAVDDMQQLNNS